MRRFLGLLFALIISVWLGLQLIKDPGFAFFSYRQWSIEMPLWFALFSLIVILLFCYTLGSWLSDINGYFYRFSNWLHWRRKNQSYSKTQRGLTELIEGHWKKAEANLIAGIPQSDVPLINYLGMAKAAHEQAAYDKRDAYLCKAHAAATHADVPIGLMQAQFQIDQGQLEQALATLNHLRTIAPQHGSVLKLIERIYIHLADWQNLLKLLPHLYKAKMITRNQLFLLEQKTQIELLKSTTNHSEESALLHEKTAALLEKTLKKSWNADLVKWYGLLNTAHPAKQLERAEQWLERYPHQAILFLTLGRLATQCQLWGKARRYFENSLSLEKNTEIYLEYGKLLEQLGDMPAALRAYRDGLLQAPTGQR